MADPVLKNLEGNTRKTHKTLDKMFDHIKEQEEALTKQQNVNERHHKEIDKLDYDKYVQKQKKI